MRIQNETVSFIKLIFVLLLVFIEACLMVLKQHTPALKEKKSSLNATRSDALSGPLLLVIGSIYCDG